VIFIRPKWFPKPISTYHPLLYHLAVFLKRTERSIEWRLDDHRYAGTIQRESFPYRIKKHQSVLIRKYSGRHDM